MIQGRRKIGIFILSILACFASIGTSAHSHAIDFLIPGISLESVSLSPGARVSYLVIATSFGAIDSSYVELRVLDRAGGEVHLEVVSSPYPRSKEESIAVRLRLSERVTAISSPDEFRACLREMRIRNGSAPFRAPTDREREEFDIEALFVRSKDGAERTELEPAAVSTPAGVFNCRGVRISKRQNRLVNLGGIRAERIEEEESTVRLSGDVPFWGLVKATVERRSFTKASLGRSGSDSPRVTTTESILLSYTKPRGRS